MVVEGEMDNNVTEPVTFWVGLIFLRISSDPKHLIPSHLISVMRRKKIQIIQNSSATKTNNLHLHRHWIITYISQNTESRYKFFQHPKTKKNYKENVATVQEMDPTWITTVLLVPCVVVLTAGLFYLYGAVIGLLSKTSVRNKVVVITDALSGLGKGNVTASKEPFLQWPHVCDL